MKEGNRRKRIENGIKVTTFSRGPKVVRHDLKSSSHFSTNYFRVYMLYR